MARGVEGRAGTLGSLAGIGSVWATGEDHVGAGSVVLGPGAVLNSVKNRLPGGVEGRANRADAVRVAAHVVAARGVVHDPVGTVEHHVQAELAGRVPVRLGP